MQPTENIENLSASTRGLRVRTTVSTVWSAARSKTLNTKQQRRLFDVMPIQKVTIQEVFLLSEGYTMTSYASLYNKQWHLLMSSGSNLPVPYREQPRSTRISLSRSHINTKVHDGGGLKLAREPASTCPKPCASSKRARNLPVRALYFVTRVQPSHSASPHPSPVPRANLVLIDGLSQFRYHHRRKRSGFFIQLAVHRHRHRVRR